MRTETKVTTASLRELGDQGCAGSDVFPGEAYWRRGLEHREGCVPRWMINRYEHVQESPQQIRACAGNSREKPHQLGTGGLAVVGASMLSGSKLD